MPSFIDIVKPSDFLTTRLTGSQLRNDEKEVVAGNIIIFFQRNGDSWFDFSFEEYCAFCGNTAVTRAEKSILDLFVTTRLLDFRAGKYSVNEKFIRKLADFIKYDE